MSKQAAPSEVWYRIEDGRYAPMPDELGNFWTQAHGRAYITVREHRVLRRTRTGVWLDNYGAEKFVRRDARKRWACPTYEEAVESFLARKRRQQSILKSQLSHVREVLQMEVPRPLSSEKEART